MRGGRGGYVYTYVDEVGSSVQPSGDFAPSSGGANGSNRAMRFHGNLAQSAEAYAGLG